MTEEFRHNDEKSQYEVWIDGEFAGEAAYTVHDGVALFNHTFVKHSLRVNGVASRLVEYAFDDVRAAGQWKINPACPYVVYWVTKHPEYDDLLV